MGIELNIYAYDIKRGDYLHMTKENGRSSGGFSYVQHVTTNDDTVTVTIAAGVYNVDVTLGANDAVTVER